MVVLQVSRKDKTKDQLKIPGPAVEKIVRGVAPISGEIFRYNVRSRSGNVMHLVDISENGFYGQCSCEAFRFKYGPKLTHGIPLDNSLMCYHIKMARKHFTESMMRRMWYELNKPKPNHNLRPIVEETEITKTEPRPIGGRVEPKTYQLKPRERFIQEL